MNHNFELSGFGYKLRPVRRSDSQFIWELRSGSVRSQYLHPVGPDASAQLMWIDEYLKRQGDYYFIVEGLLTGRREGTIGLWEVDEVAGTAQWGRWILLSDSMAAVESVRLLYEFSFKVLGLSEVFCRTVVKNAKVASFHHSLGVKRTEFLPQHFSINSELLDAVEHRLNDVEWEEVKGRVLRLTSRATGDGRYV